MHKIVGTDTSPDIKHTNGSVIHISLGIEFSNAPLALLVHETFLSFLVFEILILRIFFKLATGGHLRLQSQGHI